MYLEGNLIMNKIQKLRKRMNLSQSKFAQYFNIPTRTIQHWEQDISKPPSYIPEMMERILDLEDKLRKE